LIGDGAQGTELHSTIDAPVINAVDSSGAPLSKFWIEGFTIRGGGKANTSAHGISTTWTNFCGILNCIFFGCRNAVDVTQAFHYRMDGLFIHGANGSASTFILN